MMVDFFICVDGVFLHDKVEIALGQIIAIFKVFRMSFHGFDLRNEIVICDVLVAGSYKDPEVILCHIPFFHCIDQPFHCLLRLQAAAHRLHDPAVT